MRQSTDACRAYKLDDTGNKELRPNAYLSGGQ